MPKVDQLVAHRGYPQQYPENTLVGIEAALALGAKFIEIDVQFSADRVPYLYHDANMERVSSETGLLMELDSSQLADYHAGETERFGSRFSHTPISPLADLVPTLLAHPDVQFFIELKSDSIDYFGTETCLIKIVEHLEEKLDNCIFISYNEQAVDQARLFGFQQTGIVSRNWPERNEQIKRCQANWFFINYKRLPESEAISADCPVVLYEITDQTLANKLLQRGASKIETFDFSGMLD